ncbi:SurA N-terminal domain-containing protein [Candidatus Nomurabacteria bacterium]|nr:SurA N-terminal domain-containing protein [Candidatus Kaiserbacteria bacterium]MCB9815352.1 SurA N-terminal domain-containing protein [Candidatus Nomurabacteria bacterium]MCB9819574.1 SurA N-terminal domain-containing protein [Candidatus Nomurabacteria bacterium]
MSEHETKPTSAESTLTSSETTTVSEPVRKLSVKFYVISIAIVIVIILGVLFQLEKEGRSSTNFFGTYLANQEANRVVAVVNGEDLLNKNLEISIEQFNQMAIAQGVDISSEDTKAKIHKQSLEVLVNTELLKQAAAERGLSISDEQVDTRLEEIKTELGGEEVLNEKMNSLGIGVEKLQEDVKDELLIKVLLDEVFSENNINVTEEEISDVYNQAGGEEAGLPALEDVTDQIAEQIRTSKEQEVVDTYLAELRATAEIEIVE